jgi:hypothetical protein
MSVGDPNDRPLRRSRGFVLPSVQEVQRKGYEQDRKKSPGQIETNDSCEQQRDDDVAHANPSRD